MGIKQLVEMDKIPSDPMLIEIEANSSDIMFFDSENGEPDEEQVADSHHKHATDFTFP